LKNRFLPIDKLPRTGYPENKSLSWFQRDNPEEYEKSGNPEYSRTEIIYRFNNLGYRCAEFKKENALRIISVGCSYVFGFGLPERDIFHQLFADRLSEHIGIPVINWNLGMVGASNDYIARILQLSVPLLDPDIVLINFTRLPRREYVAAHGKLVSYLPNYVPFDPTGREIYDHFDKLSSSHDDVLNLYKNYKSIESLLRDKCWLYSFMTKSERESIQEHLDQRRLAGSFLYNDKARDNEHPGRRSHASICDKYWERFVELGSLERFRNFPKGSKHE
jgi:hypothetical protein